MRATTVEIPRNPSEEGEGLGENPAPVTKGISDEDQESSSSDPSENASERSAADRTTETITKQDQTDPNNVANKDAPRTTGRREDDKDVKSSTTDLWPENPVTSGRRMAADGSKTKNKIGEVEVLAQPLLEVGEVERLLQDHHLPSHCHCCHHHHQESTKKRVARLLANNPLIDGHNDFPLSIRS